MKQAKEWMPKAFSKSFLSKLNIPNAHIYSHHKHSQAVLPFASIWPGSESSLHVWLIKISTPALALDLSHMFIKIIVVALVSFLFC